MTIALIGNEVLGLILLVAVVTLLAGAIYRSRRDEVRLAHATRRRGLHARRRTPSASPARVSWTARPDAS